MIDQNRKDLMRLEELFCSRVSHQPAAVLPAVMKTVTRCLRSAVKTNSEYRAMKTKGDETGTNGEETGNQLLLHS